MVYVRSMAQRRMREAVWRLIRDDSAVRIRFGERLQGSRKRARFSIREVASRGGINKDTVMRIERGELVRRESLEKLTAVYGALSLAEEYVREPSLSGLGYSVHLPTDDIWYRVRFDGEEVGSPIVGEGQELSRSERMGLAGFRFADQFFRRLRCDLPGARGQSAQLEVYGMGGFSQQPEGHGFIYVIDGLLGFWHGESEMVIPTGGCVMFDRKIRHRHGNLREDDLPTEILYVQIH